MNRFFRFFVFVLFFFFFSLPISFSSEYQSIPNHSFQGLSLVNSWKSMRDERIVKQDLDHSCGAASLATILGEYYGLSVTEREILEAMDKKDMRASFDDMASVLLKYGFRGIGYAVSFEQLTSLKIPVVVYTKHRKDDHFSVLRGISNDTVWLADPSLGNRTYSRHQFIEMWQTRADPKLQGKILAIVPLKQQVQNVGSFFTNQPRRQTAQAVQQQGYRITP